MNFIPKIVYSNTIIQFTKPPQGDYLNQVIDASEITTKSFNGKTQTTWAYNSNFISPEFFLVEHDVKESLQTFLSTYAVKGVTFNYFPHSDEATFYSVTLKDKRFEPKIVAIQGADKFFWEFTLKMEVVN